MKCPVVVIALGLVLTSLRVFGECVPVSQLAHTGLTKAGDAYFTAFNPTLEPSTESYKLLHDIAKRITKGQTALYDVWPNGQLARPTEDQHGKLQQLGGSFALGGGVHVSSSRVIYDANGHVQTVLMNVDGACLKKRDLDASFSPLIAGEAVPGAGYKIHSLYSQQANAAIKFVFGPDRPSCVQKISVFPRTT